MRLRSTVLILIITNMAFGQVSLDRLGIEVKDTTREFAYTNKQDAFYYGETNSGNSSSWQGFNVFGHEFLDDYGIRIGGIALNRNEAATVVYPDYLKRTYPNGIEEELRFADSIRVFSVTVTAQKKPADIQVIPLVNDGMQPQDFVIQRGEHSILLARKAHTSRTISEDYPVWLAIGGKNFEVDSSAIVMGTQFAPFSLKFGRAKQCTIVFAVADDADAADRLLSEYLDTKSKYDTARRQRMIRVLMDSWEQTRNKRFDAALQWAKISMDALIMNQVTKGIFAGLPWFNNYWGRDTFISLPGATLVTGRFEEAKAILRSFAAYQQIDSTSTDYGRIPNIVTTTDKAYNTADGTPRFMMMAKEYVERSGDSSFILEIYPTVIRSIEGTLKYHVDDFGFLTHGDAETWMDAVGPDGPWSPRGNRANDIQALWAQQLEAGVWFATQVGDAGSAHEWHTLLSRLKKNFQERFVSRDGVVADHLLQNGEKDTHLRPNQIFACTLLDDSTRARVVHTVLDNLTYEYGVASLSQNDDDFHPYHQYEPYYPKDAAYHNGTVWTWLQGALISELCHFGKEHLAYHITDNSVHQILDRGAVGTQSELLDAVPRPGEAEPGLSGTFSQAWTLAEFIRNFYDDYLGVRVDRYNHTLTIRPHVPSSLGKIQALINIDDREIPIVVDQHSRLQRITLNTEDLHHPYTTIIELPTPEGRVAHSEFQLLPKSVVTFDVDGKTITLKVNGKRHVSGSAFVDEPNYDQWLEPLAFATPRIQQGLKALRGPEYPLLPNSTIKLANPTAATLIDASDSVGDDIGDGNFVYPRNAFFKPGIFDITRFVVARDSANAYFTLKFRSLSNPGWHPEYGFQLTYVAIAIDQDSIPGSGARKVPHNAGYTLPEKHGYEKLILVGGGVQLEDSNGKILAAYVPTSPDVKNLLGDPATGTISFAIPLAYLGTPDSAWTFTVLAGAQDDHGGSGLGEFRSVNKEASEWNGGGKQAPNGSNIYDVLVAPDR